MARVLLISHGTGGDLFPFMRIASRLKDRGHEVTLVTNRSFEGVVGRAGFRFRALEKLLQVEQWNEAQLRGGGRPGVELLVDAVEEVCDVAREHGHADGGVVCGNYNLNIAVQTACEKLGTPYLPVFTAPYFLVSAALTAELLSAQSAHLNEVRARLGLPPVADWRLWVNSAPRGIGLWPEWFAAPEPGWPVRVTPVGFVRLPEVEEGEVPAEVRDLLDEGEAPLLINHGTSVPLKPEFFAVSARACEALGRKGLLVTRHDEVVPNPLPGGVKKYKYLPFAAVMPRVAAVIHHGGIGTLGQALSSGTPQLVLAFGHDRPDNGARLKRLGVGEWLPPLRWRLDAVTESLRRLLNSPEVSARCHALGRRAREGDPAAAACDLFERAASG